MAMITMSNVGEALKVHYLPVIRDQMNNKLTPFYAAIVKDSTDVVGEKAVFAMKYGRNGGVGNRADDGDLPKTNPRKVKQASVVTKNIFARTQFTQKVIDASKNSEGSFVNVLTSELEDIMKDAKEQFARQLHGDGSGVFATVGTAGSTTEVIPVDNIDSFAVGMLIDITHASASTTVKYGGSTPLDIVDVDYDASTITLSADPGDTASGDGICVNGSAGLELTGLKKIFSTDTLYGIERATTNKWAVPINHNEAGEIDDISMQTVLDLIDTRTGGDPNFLLTSKGVKRAYLKMQQAYKRNTEYMDIKGGFNVMSYAGKPFTDDKYAVKGEIKFLSLDDFKIHRMSDWEWLNKDGSVFERVANKAAWEATLYCFAELATSRPGGNGRLYGITEH